MIKNTSGSITLFLLLFLPILMATTAVCIGSIVTINQYSEAQHLCRKKLLKIQNNLIPYIERILLLNYEVQSNRLEIQTAKVALATAIISGNPISIVVARKNSELAEIHKKLIMAQQRQLLTAAFIEGKNSILQFHEDYILQRRKNNNQFHYLVQSVNERIYTSPIKVAITKSDNIEPPIYKIKQNFEKEQELQTNWEFTFKANRNNFLSNQIQFNHTIKGTCSASISRRSEKWTETLTAGK